VAGHRRDVVLQIQGVGMGAVARKRVSSDVAALYSARGLPHWDVSHPGAFHVPIGLEGGGIFMRQSRLVIN
jgi:hypothetical protein